MILPRRHVNRRAETGRSELLNPTTLWPSGIRAWGPKNLILAALPLWWPYAWAALQESLSQQNAYQLLCAISFDTSSHTLLTISVWPVFSSSSTLQYRARYLWSRCVIYSWLWGHPAKCIWSTRLHGKLDSFRVPQLQEISGPALATKSHNRKFKIDHDEKRNYKHQ